MSAGVIFREKGKIVERTVAQAKLQFFADSGTDAPLNSFWNAILVQTLKCQLIIQITKLTKQIIHLIIQKNWIAVPYHANKDIEAGDEINVTFKEVKAKAMRWRMERKADKSGVAMIEMFFLASSELPQESTTSEDSCRWKRTSRFY